jgi:hypothetical protein
MVSAAEVQRGPERRGSARKKCIGRVAARKNTRFCMFLGCGGRGRLCTYSFIVLIEVSDHNPTPDVCLGRLTPHGQTPTWAHAKMWLCGAILRGTGFFFFWIINYRFITDTRSVEQRNKWNSIGGFYIY